MRSPAISGTETERRCEIPLLGTVLRLVVLCWYKKEDRGSNKAGGGSEVFDLKICLWHFCDLSLLLKKL
jgi:hypothetical protein